MPIHTHVRRKIDNTATVSVILDRLAHEGPPLLMDPPPLPEQSEGINKVIDMVYEKKLKTTVHSKKSLIPLSSLVLVLPHEMQNLKVFNNTSLSKAVICFHKIQDSEVESGVESGDSKEGIDRGILENYKSF